MLKVSQVAERLNCSISTVYSLVESGKLGHHRCPGIRVGEEQLAAFLEGTKKEQGPVSPPRSTGRCPRLKHITI
jgi:excisionase family DNA binding protein